MDHDRKIMICWILAAVFSPVFGEENWKATVVKTIEALVGSCVVLPCTFTHPEGQLPNSRLRGIWHRNDDNNEMLYHEDETKIQDSFKDRTKLLGYLDDPRKPKFGPLKPAVEGKPYTVTCSIRHTCASHWPEITWSRGSKDDIIEVHKDINGGIWETESILAFIPEEKDDHTNLTCTAKFHGGKSSSTAFMLNVKRMENYNHIIISVVAVAATAVIFGLVCVLMVKKYKKRIQELQSRDGSQQPPNYKKDNDDNDA
ncbi:uncharacterized protein LOC110367199 isoform X2 [Fundulus heteroclitus]|uniref:uncharacterized protein LOC110367199 isoform X2 n=1 Tax=Fundulus heteroclitus TaxID=8078 RepID=UPI00165B71A4|nr:uncharacterized protein LOC110367199 isoform X2 [Fundulus heteroclitus]